MVDQVQCSRLVLFTQYKLMSHLVVRNKATNNKNNESWTTFCSNRFHIQFFRTLRRSFRRLHAPVVPGSASQRRERNRTMKPIVTKTALNAFSARVTTNKALHVVVRLYNKNRGRMCRLLVGTLAQNYSKLTNREQSFTAVTRPADLVRGTQKKKM